jgi:hypothetical protein
MKVKTWVEFANEVEVEIDADDILTCFGETPDPGESWLQVLNRFAMCLNAMPDAVIAGLSPKQQELIGAFLLQQSQRFSTHLSQTDP